MKNKCAKVLLIFMAMIFEVGAFAFEPVTLKDDKTGMTVDLYPIPDEEELLFYGNMRFGYNVSVPYKFFTQVVLLPENEDGMILGSKDWTARLPLSRWRSKTTRPERRLSFTRSWMRKNCFFTATCVSATT